MAETRISPPDTARCHFVPASDTPKHSHAARSACTALRRAGGAGGQALPPASPSERTGLGAASSPASTSRSPSVGSAACSKGRTDAPWPSCLLPPLFPHLVLASAPPPVLLVSVEVGGGRYQHIPSSGPNRQHPTE